MNHFVRLSFTAILCFPVWSLAQPVITANPQSATFCVDSCAAMRVTAVGSSLQYQWQYDSNGTFVNWEFGTYGEDSLKVCDIGFEAPTSWTMRCAVWDANDTVFSNTAVLTFDSCIAPRADFSYSVSGSEACFENLSARATSYLWIFGDGNTGSAEEPCHDYGSEWLFDATLFAFNDFGQDSVTKTINLVAIAELLSEQVRLYPNPASDVLHMQASTRISEMRVMDLQGKVVSISAASSASQTISIAHLPAGVYTLVLQSETGVSYHKFVKATL